MATERTAPELKAEVLSPTERQVYPLAGVTKEAASGNDARAPSRRTYTLYRLARFPLADSPRKQEAYQRASKRF